MAIKQNIISLIKSMNPSEKRRFKSFSNYEEKEGSNATYLTLYELLLRGKEKPIAAFYASQKNISSIQKKLQTKILDVLRIHNQKASSKIKRLNGLSDVHILYDKKCYPLVLSLLNRAPKTKSKEIDLVDKLQYLDWEKNVFIHSGFAHFPDKKVDALIENESLATHALYQKNRLKIIEYQLQLLTDDSNIVKSKDFINALQSLNIDFEEIVKDKQSAVFYQSFIFRVQAKFLYYNKQYKDALIAITAALSHDKHKDLHSVQEIEETKHSFYWLIQIYWQQKKSTDLTLEKIIAESNLLKILQCFLHSEELQVYCLLANINYYILHRMDETAWHMFTDEQKRLDLIQNLDASIVKYQGILAILILLFRKGLPKRLIEIGEELFKDSYLINFEAQHLAIKIIVSMSYLQLGLIYKEVDQVNQLRLSKRFKDNPESLESIVIALLVNSLASNENKTPSFTNLQLLERAKKSKKSPTQNLHYCFLDPEDISSFFDQKNRK